MKKKYTVITAEPGYENSQEIIATGLSAKQAVSRWYALRKAYLCDPKNNPSYAEIVLEGVEVDFADEDTVYGCSFGCAVDPVWKISHEVAQTTNALLKDYAY